MQCGNRLARVCPACATPNDTENRFCFSCGTNLESPAAPSGPVSDPGKLRLVSVVFADIVGYTSFSENRDPEDVRSLLTSYYDRCREIISRYGGVTDKFIGDAVMGVWGAERANEDDAERATRAALELVDMVAGLGGEVGVDGLAARAGVLSGEASVGSGGNDHGLVVGDLVNTASRLQSIAPPGGVYVGQTTKDLVGSSIEFVPVGEQMVKGKEIPVAVFHARRVVALSISHGGGELGSGPFVGRDDELRLLKDQLNATGREGRSRMVTIVGEAGIGKTRLSQELVRYLDGIAEDIYYHRGRSPSYGEGVTYWALGEMIRERAGILESDDDAKSRLRLRTVVAEYAPDPADQQWIEPRLAAILGLAPMPSGDRNELFAALRLFFQRISDKGTVLMVFEDLHWADDGLLDFIDELVERTPQHPIMVVSLARPEIYERHPEWGVGRRRSLSMDLAPLALDTMRELVHGLAPDLPVDSVDLISSRSGGVPLHAVEFVRMLVNSGVLAPGPTGLQMVGEMGSLAIPDTLNAIVGARLDRLPPDEIALIQDGAVLGLSFTVNDLAWLRGVDPTDLEDGLVDLVRREVLEVDSDPRSPERGHYRFVQGLIREVAYGRMSKSERVSRHLEIAERWDTEADPELAAIVSSHYASAAAADPANTELLDRARNAVIAAAERAASLFSDSQAVSLYNQAIDLTQDPSERSHLQVRTSKSLDASGRSADALALVRSARAWFEGADDERGVALAATAEANILSNNFGTEAAVDAILPVYQGVSQQDDAIWTGVAAETARALVLSGLMDQALEVAEQVIPVLQRLGDVENTLQAMITKATGLPESRSLEREALFRGVVSLASENGLTSAHWRALNNWAAVAEGDTLRPDPQIRDEISIIVERAGSIPNIAADRYFVAEDMFGDGKLREAIEHTGEFLAEDPPPVWASLAEMQSLVFEMVLLGFDETRYERLLRLGVEADDGSDLGSSVLFAEQITTGSWCAGDYERAVESVLEDERSTLSPYPYALHVALYAGAMDGDVSRFQRIVDRVDSLSGGRAINALNGYARCVLLAMTGDPEAAVLEFEAADALGGVVFNDMSLAVTRAICAVVIGVDSPVMATAAGQALEFFDASECLLYQDRFASLRLNEFQEKVS